MRVILPGSYDPVTLGHLEIIKRAKELYGEVYAVVFNNPEKSYTFSPEERVKMLELAIEGMGVFVDYSGGLVIDYMKAHGIEKIVKGYRNQKDLEYEREMAEWNKEHGGFETELLPAREAFSGISSTLARERIKSGEDLSGILPEKVIGFIGNS